MTRTKTLILALAAVLLAALPAQAADLWFHVKVQEAEGEHANVTVNLPLSLVESFLAAVPQEHLRDGNIVIENAEFDAARLRELWREVQDTPDMTFVTVATDDETVKVAKDRGYLVARTTDRSEHGAEVNARIPLTVVEALLSGEGNTLNLQAALAALAAHGEGELVTVNERDNTVRVWIDSNPEAR
jgi:hypothetical protein